MSHPWTLSEIFILRHAGFPFDWLESLGASPIVLNEVRALLALEPNTPSWNAQWAIAEAAYNNDLERLRVRLHELAQDERVQEAVFLSSPDMFENVWRRYVESNCGADNSKTRRIERQVYSYLQRLCAKNETTSFFGPMGYGEVEGDGDSIEFHRAEPRRKTFIAYWATEALARAIASEPELWSAIPIQRNPLFSIDSANRVARCDPLDREEKVTEDELGLIGAVETCGDADRLATLLSSSRARIECLAMSLIRKGILVRRLAFRSDVPSAFGQLRAPVQALPECSARQRWISELEKLDSLRAQFETAVFNDRRVLLPQIESLFTRLSRVPGRRAGGRLYTDRLVLNEEASSPFFLRIGTKALQKLEAALSPLLEISAAYGDAFQGACRDQAREFLTAEAAPIPFLKYATALRESRPIFPEVRRLDLEADDSERVQIRADFCGVPFPGSRFALPDVALGQNANGEFHVVLSSLHHNLLTRGWMFTFYSDSDRAERVASRWLHEDTGPSPLVELATGRHNKGYYSFPGKRLANASGETNDAGHGVIAAADAIVCLQTWKDGQPILRGPDGTSYRLYLPLADLTLHPPFAALASPMVLRAPIQSSTSVQHTPRCDVAEATYQRERWKTSFLAGSKLPGFALFVAMQKERERLGIPRFAFARVKGERKPFLVDTESPFAIDLLRHLAFGSPDVVFEEMLPAPDQLWLRDERGRYTFELRIQAART